MTRAGVPRAAEVALAQLVSRVATPEETSRAIADKLAA